MNRVQQSIVLIGFTMAIASIILLTIEKPAFAIEYTNEKCGVSVQYPEGWQVENDDTKIDKLRSFVTFSPNPYDYPTRISLNVWDISDYREKTIEYVSDIFASPESGYGLTYTVIRDDITQVGGFPAQELAYSEEFKGDKTYFMDVNILAYDKLYQIELETENFDKHSPLVEEIANSIKILKPNFEGINC